MQPVLSATEAKIKRLAMPFRDGHLPCFQNGAECYALAGREFQDAAILSKRHGHRIWVQQGDLFMNTHDRSTTELLLTAGKGETFHSRFESIVYPLQSSVKVPFAPVAAHD